MPAHSPEYVRSTLEKSLALRNPSRIALAMLLLCGCPTNSRPPVVTGDGGGGGGMGDPCSGNMHRCNNLTWQSCKNNIFVDDKTCAAACDAALGCVDCSPKTTFCEGDVVKQCNPDGTKGGEIVTCVAGGCVGGTCTDPCGKAAAEFSYLGCDYFPTVTVNSGLTQNAHFAVAVSNPGGDPVDVTISRLGKFLNRDTIAPGDLKTFTLPWVNELKEPYTDQLKSNFASGLVAGGAFKLTASAPVTVYQFNPLEFKTSPNCTADQPGCFTFTNDASLLLPISTLTRHYIVIARPTFMVQYTSNGFSTYLKDAGFFSVVGAENARTTVTVNFNAGTLAGANGSIKAYKKGQVDTFSLQQGDVIQFLSDIPMTCKAIMNENATDAQGNPITYGYCDLPATDLTGTEITADRKIAVFAGHDCTFIPFNRWACDHLEEEMLPVESWGKDYLGIHTNRTPFNIPDYWRIVSAVDNNTINFDPAAVHAPVTLNKGEFVEFSTRTDFEALGSGPFGMAQYMAGQDWNGLGSGGGKAGDPAMSIAVPLEQYRKNYNFLTPDTYVLNYVNVTGTAGAKITLDGKAIDPTQFAAVGAGKYVAAHLTVPAGAHKIESDQPFGIAIYGLAPYTSYMYPGGLDVRQINVQ